MGCIIFHRREYDKNRYIMKDGKELVRVEDKSEKPTAGRNRYRFLKDSPKHIDIDL